MTNRATHSLEVMCGLWALVRKLGVRGVTASRRHGTVVTWGGAVTWGRWQVVGIAP
ncbi:hypothetical protein PHO31112_04776 [Pandoraea horticolens]|uniref:Uncharacterized protein n=1 Tax=Pandoraea horticolens TaxID=2508298 RepID=A0A5E4YU07_9BURK|nr:hypothetical protein [Pandoraea horticolens]VVE52329.1 hypothetical protein PHO31112_04776 [Pandoraea horticolens]